MYYIQRGYVGNSVLWWCQDYREYTTDFSLAGKYTLEQAIEICKDPLKRDTAWPCWILSIT